MPEISGRSFFLSNATQSGDAMTSIKYALGRYPLSTTLGGIDWLKELRVTESLESLAVIDGVRAGQLETRATLVGALEDYSIYFLASRARVRLVPNPDWSGQYILNEITANGEICVKFLLEADVPKNVDPPRALAKLAITPDLEQLLKDIGKTRNKVCGITLPAQAGFSNALEFRFSQDEGPAGPIAMNITPALTGFITIPDSESARVFMSHVAYDIHYIGQATSTVEKRLHAHEKIRMMADILLTKQLDQEPVVFSYTYTCDGTLERQTALDILEATLISYFKPVLNIDKKNFPAGSSPTEKNLRKRYEEIGLDHVEVETIGYLHRNEGNREMLLSDGFGCTRRENGDVRAVSNSPIVLTPEDFKRALASI
jgi:hypothetical protein